MELLYNDIITLVTANADQTPPAAVGRLPPFVRRWRLKYEFENGRYRNRPLHDAAPGSLRTFLPRAVATHNIDLTSYVQTEDFYVDPDPMIVVTYRNFEHFHDRPFAAVPGGGGGTVAAAPRFYFKPAAISYSRGYEALRLFVMKTSPLLAESPGD
jgi:hypothetical protein